MPRRKVDKTYDVLSEIEELLRKQNSLWNTFAQGIVRGLGTAIGATVLVAIATSIAIQLSDTFNMEHFLNAVFEDSLRE